MIKNGSIAQLGSSERLKISASFVQIGLGPPNAFIV